MPKIDPRELEQLEKQGIEIKKDNNGNPIAFKGPWLEDWYDNYMEMLRENQKELRIRTNKKHGLNEHGQTKEQEADFKKRKLHAEDKKRKAELAAEMAFQNK